MSTWQHKGFEIAIDGAQFAVTINGRRVRSNSLNAAKKAIDKHIDVKAKEVVLSLPVALVSKNAGVVEVQRGVITGLDISTLDPVGEHLEPLRGYRRASVMPDSEESVKIYREYVEAEKAYEDATEAFRNRCVSVNFNKFGRLKRTHAEAVELLQQSYKDACNPKP